MNNIEQLKSNMNSDIEFLRSQLESDMRSLLDVLQSDLNRLIEKNELNNIEYIYKTALSMNVNYTILKMNENYINDLNK